MESSRVPIDSLGSPANHDLGGNPVEEYLRATEDSPRFSRNSQNLEHKQRYFSTVERRFNLGGNEAPFQAHLYNTEIIQKRCSCCTVRGLSVAEGAMLWLETSSSMILRSKLSEIFTSFTRGASSNNPVVGLNSSLTEGAGRLCDRFPRAGSILHRRLESAMIVKAGCLIHVFGDAQKGSYIATHSSQQKHFNLRKCSERGSKVELLGMRYVGKLA